MPQPYKPGIMSLLRGGKRSTTAKPKPVPKKPKRQPGIMSLLQGNKK